MGTTTGKKGSGKKGGAATAGRRLRDALLALASVASAAIAVIGGLAALKFTWRLAGILFIASALTLICTVISARADRPRWLYLTTAGIASAALIAGSAYCFYRNSSVVAGGRSSSSASAANPQLHFVAQSQPLTVPYCDSFRLRILGRLESGEQIAIFDASADTQFHAVSKYSFDGLASPAGDGSGEYSTPNIFVAAEYRQDDNGHDVIINGKHVINATYKVAIFAAVVRGGAANVLGNAAPTSSLLLNSLPPAVSRPAELHVVRSSQIGNCPPSPS
jgi:hypothetical protein